MYTSNAFENKLHLNESSNNPMSTEKLSATESNPKKMTLQQRVGPDGRLKFIPKTFKNYYCTQNHFRKQTLADIPIDLFGGSNTFGDIKPAR